MARILHVISGLEVGGAEMMLLRLIRNEALQKYDQVVVALSPEGAMRGKLRNAGVELFIFDFRRAPVSDFVRLLLLLRRMKPHLVQTWMYHADLIGGIAALLAGRKNIVWGIRTTDVRKGSSPTASLFRWFCARLSYRIPKKITCVAEAARRLHVGLGYSSERMVVIPNGFDLTRLQAGAAMVAALRQTCGLGDDVLVVGTLGRFNAVKDQQNFVRAAGVLAQQYPAARFLLVGRGCDATNGVLAAWIAATGFPERFVLLGERQDAPVCLAAMDVFALPSRTEGFPNVLAEAMAMELPCVSTDVGDAAVVLGDCGEVVPPEDAQALAAGLARLLDMSAEQRAALGVAGHKRIEQEFSMAHCAERFAELYEVVLAQPGQ